MTTARVYARLSDKDKKSKGAVSDSVDYQLEQGRVQAERDGITRVVEYWDDDRSAWSGKPRKDWERLRADLEPGDVVIARHADRLTRDIEDAVNFANLCRTKRVGLSLVYGGRLNMNDSRDRLRFIEDSGRAEYESGVKSERVQDSVQRRLAEGRDLGGSRPFGFKKDRTKIREREAKWIREAYAKVLDEGVTVYAVAKWLNEENVPTAGKADLWTPRAVRALLLRPRNAGVLMHKGVEVSTDKLPAIVSRKDWQAMTAFLNDDSRKPKRGPQTVHLLSGIAKCAVCGYTLAHTVSRKGRKDDPKTRAYGVYRCSNNQPVGRGTHPTMRDEALEDAAVTQLLDLIADGGNPDGGEASKLRTLTARLNEIAEDKAQATAMGLMRGANLRAVQARLDELEAEREAREAERDALLSDTASGAAFDEFREYVRANVGEKGWGYMVARNAAWEVWEEYDIQRQRAILRGFEVKLHPTGETDRVTVTRR